MTIISFSDVLKEGSLLEDTSSSWDVVTKDTFYTFSYTSGTTGAPKGVMLTHGNYISSMANNEAFEISDYTDEDVYISYLPLAHVFERLMILGAMAIKM